MVPEGWTSQAMTSVLEKVIDYRGKAPPKADEGVRLLTARNVRPGHVSFDHAEFIDANKYRNWMNRGLPRQGDILFTTEAPLGNVAMFPSEGTFALGQRIVTLRTNNTAAPGYLFQFLLSEHGQSLVFAKSSGSTALGIKSKELVKIRIPLPPLPEQRKIAEILSTWDRAIEMADAQLANARKQKRALMQSLLTGKRRFPEFAGQKWREVRFEDVFSRVRRKNTAGNDNVLTISAQHGLVSQEHYFNKRVAAQDLSGYTLLQQGDFAYNKSYSQGYPLGAIKMLESEQPGVVSSLYLCFALSDATQYSREFFRHYFEAGCFNREIYKIAQEGARNHGLLNVSATDFFRAQLHVPELEEQRMIARTIGTAEVQEEIHRREILRLKTEKKALMQQLLTGKRRVTG
ncbi:restriction endonuclease subunit S [Phaeobacter italicus]|uniref:restriction endonuclease subunit S n=1 Tax=Phaeobacter italicus TaxID=481446 RepID=UPI001ADD5DB9|nr:restriction endonuclease subunit S [Phaeobacter italicus]MBO9444176.1 restriction endonuclease subunit S [Phaeobacter italicus]